MSILDVAYEMHITACRRYGQVRDRRLAHPFGVPEVMPPHRWVVSAAMMQALTEAAPPPFSVPNPKTSEGSEKLLFGWPLTVDRDAPPETFRLVSAVGSAVLGSESGGDERIRTAE